MALMQAHYAWGALRYYYFQHVCPYPDDFSANAVAPRLYVGDLHSAFDAPHLQARHITHVVNLVPGIPPLHDNVVYCHVPCLDHEAFDITTAFATTNAFIQDALNDPDHNVLVHCSVGRSRSVAVAMAYLVATTTKSVARILKDVQRERPIAQPNDGFMAQLDAYHAHMSNQLYTNASS